MLTIITAWAILGRERSSDLDQRSYTAGYNEAFGGAHVPTDTAGRNEIEANCDALFTDWVRSSGKQGIVRADWVEGCADVTQNKDSRF
ncbi:hypothetical protein ACF06W_11840 [Streptomyces albus]|uniref:hypothetical protein n=1 Tax=Streptomyces albus TaxID=1888 RepID=UPI0036FAD9A2